MLITFDTGSNVTFFEREIIACPWVDETVLEHGDTHGDNYGNMAEA